MWSKCFEVDGIRRENTPTSGGHIQILNTDHLVISMLFRGVAFWKYFLTLLTFVLNATKQGAIKPRERKIRQHVLTDYFSYVPRVRFELTTSRV